MALKLNPLSLGWLILSARKKYGPISVILNGGNIEIQNTIRYLGIWFNKNLNFDQHITTVVGNVKMTVNSLKRRLPLISNTKERKRTLLTSVLKSKHLYAVHIWDTVCKYRTYADINQRMLRRMLSTELITQDRSLWDNRPWTVYFLIFCEDRDNAGNGINKELW